MKALLFSIILASLPLSAQETLSIDNLTEYVSKQNYIVLEEAQRVYQSKQTIKHARNSLLPRLNLWSILQIPAVFVDPFVLGDIVQDVAPFLVPANWFKVRQANAMAKVQAQQYLAVWANELVTARLLFLELYREQELYGILQQSLESYKRVRRIARLRSEFGTDGGFALNLIDERILALEDDIRSLDLLFSSTKRELQLMTGIDQARDVTIVAPNLLNPLEADALDEELLWQVIEASAPELKQFSHLEQALAAVRGSLRFNILGTSTYSAGNADQVFSSIPLSDGLGFGQGNAVNITKSEGEILRLKFKASQQTLMRQFKLLAQEYGLLNILFASAIERNDLSVLNQQLLESRLRYGGDISPLELIEALDNVTQTQLLKLSYQVRFNEVVEKIKRMTFTAPYRVGGEEHE